MPALCFQCVDAHENPLSVVVKIVGALAIPSGSNRQPWVEHYVCKSKPRHDVMVSNSLQGVVQTYEATASAQHSRGTNSPGRKTRFPEKCRTVRFYAP